MGYKELVRSYVVANTTFIREHAKLAFQRPPLIIELSQATQEDHNQLMEWRLTLHCTLVLITTPVPTTLVNMLVRKIHLSPAF